MNDNQGMPGPAPDRTPTSKRVLLGLGAGVVGIALLLAIGDTSRRPEPRAPDEVEDGALVDTTWEASGAEPGPEPAPSTEDTARQAEAAARWRGLEIAIGER